MFQNFKFIWEFYVSSANFEVFTLKNYLSRIICGNIMVQNYYLIFFMVPQKCLLENEQISNAIVVKKPILKDNNQLMSILEVAQIKFDSSMIILC